MSARKSGFGDLSFRNKVATLIGALGIFSFFPMTCSAGFAYLKYGADADVKPERVKPDELADDPPSSTKLFKVGATPILARGLAVRGSGPSGDGTIFRIRESERFVLLVPRDEIPSKEEQKTWIVHRDSYALVVPEDQVEESLNASRDDIVVFVAEDTRPAARKEQETAKWMGIIAPCVGTPALLLFLVIRERRPRASSPQ